MNTENKSNLPVGVDEHDAWNGLTLDELKSQRAISLIHREFGRERFATKLNRLHSKTSQHGIRGLLFSGNEITKLRTSDYLLLGWKVAKFFIKMKNRKK